MSRIYLFDLYDTVLKDISFEFQQGMRFLYDNYFSSICSWEEFSEFENTFFPLYEQRKIENTEISLIRDEVLPIFQNFGVFPPADLDELDFQIMDHMQQETLLPSVRQTLEVLHGRNAPCISSPTRYLPQNPPGVCFDALGSMNIFAECIPALTTE